VDDAKDQAINTISFEIELPESGRSQIPAFAAIRVYNVLRT